MPPPSIADVRSLAVKWHLDEFFLRINGKTHYLWRAVDQHGSVWW